MKILLTGCAGFVGWKTGEFLLREGHSVVGLDNQNDYYPVDLKNWRTRQLREQGGDRFLFIQGELGNAALLERIFADHEPEAVINLAARAGVRPSIEQAPY